MTESQAHERFNSILQSLYPMKTYLEELTWLEKNEPCLIQPYKDYILSKTDARQFSKISISQLMIYSSPLGKLL